MNANLTYKFDVFKLTFSPLKLHENGQAVLLTPKSLKILILLIKNEGKAVSKEVILKEVWQNSYVSDSVLAVNINTLRKALGKDLIKNIKRQGYIFAGKVEAVFDEELRNENNEQSETEDSPLSFESFAGREKELRLLRLNFQAVSPDKGMAAFIGGETGIGKTKLIRRFLENIPQTADSIVLTMSFFDFIGNNNECIFLYFKIIRHAFVQLNWLDAESEFSEELIVKIIKEKLKIEISESLSSGYSNNGADDQKLGILSYKFSECIIELSKKVKTVIYFDDIQWSDELSLNLVGRLIRATLDTPLTILIAARIDEETMKISHFSQWLQNHLKQNSFIKIDLKPFALDECGELIGKIFGGRKNLKSFTDADLFEIYQITNGNPFFLREYLYWLIADEKIFRLNKNSGWVFTEIAKSSLPNSITSFANSRINLLNEKDRTILEAACVTGEEFSSQSVAKVLNLHISEIEKSLEVAVEKEILTKQILNRGNDYRFRHNLLYRMLYESILPNNKFYLHEQVALWLEESYKNDTRKVAGSLAEHYEAAQNHQKCLEWSIEAAKYAKGIEDIGKIKKDIERAENAVKKISNPNAISNLQQYYLHFFKGYYIRRYADDSNRTINFELSIAAFLKSISIANELNDPKLVADSLYDLSIIYRIIGRFSDSLDGLKKAELLYKKACFNEGIALVKKGVAGYYMVKGKYNDAINEIKSEIFRTDISIYTKMLMKNILVESYIYIGKYKESEELLLDIAESCKNLVFEYQILNRHFTRLYTYMGKYELAIEKIALISNFFTQENTLQTSVYSKVFESRIRFMQGLFTESRSIIDSVSAQVLSGKSVYLSTMLKEVLGRLLLEECNFVEANSIISKFAEFVVELDDLDLLSVKESLLAEYNNRIGKTDKANIHAKKAINFAKESGNPLNESLGYIELALSIKTYDPPEAIATAKKAVQILDEIKSGERWRAYWAVAQIQLSASAKLLKTNELVGNLEKTVDLLDEIRNQFDLNDVKNFKRYDESTKNHSEPAKHLSRLYLKLGDKENSLKIAKDWNLEL
jgi:DNA-binding winged helix-turn-helix (wHTH) protein